VSQRRSYKLEFLTEGSKPFFIASLTGSVVTVGTVIYYIYWVNKDIEGIRIAEPSASVDSDSHDSRIKDQRDPLTDGISRVELLKINGNDTLIVNAARVSLGSHTSDFNEGDAKLLECLIRNENEAPFEHASVTFRIKAPIFVVRQIMRHRFGISLKWQRWQKLPSLPFRCYLRISLLFTKRIIDIRK